MPTNHRSRGGDKGTEGCYKMNPQIPRICGSKDIPLHIKTFKKISSAFGGNITGGHFKKSNVCYCRSFTHPNTCPYFSIFSHDT
jgi:hypothetical protein